MRWLLVVLLVGCNGPEIGGAPDGGVARDLAPAPSDFSSTDDLARAVDLLAPSTDLAPTGVCPAPAPGAGVFVVYGEAVAAGWESDGFGAGLTDESTTVCSGGHALRYTAHQYDGLQFLTTGPAVTARHLSVRVHLDVASQWAVAAVKPGESDPHQFLGNPVVMTWPAGWRAVELDIPATTPQTRWILFEKQDAGNAQLVVDDLRLF